MTTQKFHRGPSESTEENYMSPSVAKADCLVIMPTLVRITLHFDLIFVINRRLRVFFNL